MEKHGLDNEKLIREVCGRRCLWDQKSVDYLNRALKAKQWEDVAFELETTVDEAKNRWKLLRDSFNREVRNLNKKCSNSSKWIHFDHMSFLLRSTNSTMLPSAYLSQSLTELDIHNTASSSCDNELSENALVITDQEMDSLTPRMKKVKTQNEDSRNSSDYTMGITVNQVKSQNLKSEQRSLRHDQENEDYYFLMSLLPSFERLSRRRKMRLKIKMMQDVYDAAFSGDTSDCEASRSDSREEISLEAVSSGT